MGSPRAPMHMHPPLTAPHAHLRASPSISEHLRASPSISEHLRGRPPPNGSESAPPPTASDAEHADLVPRTSHLFTSYLVLLTADPAALGSPCDPTAHLVHANSSSLGW